MPVVLAHLAHWYTSLAYVAPVLIIVGLLALQSWRDKRRAPTPDADGEPTPLS